MATVVSDSRSAVVAGAFAGACSTFLTNPFDVVRTKLQASREATGIAQKSLRCHTRSLFQDGLLRGFTSGLLANMVASMPSNAIYLPTYRYVSHWCTQRAMDARLAPVVSAGAAVVLTNVLLSPTFVVRSQVQANNQPMRNVVTGIFRKEGLRGFYRGLMTNVGGRFVEEGLFWSAYEFLKRTTDEGVLRPGHNFLWNAVSVMSLTSLAKLFGTTVAYPYNVVMTHIRTPNKATGLYEHTYVWKTATYIYAKDGFLGFYKGLLPQVLRSMVSKSTQIYAFELSLAAMVSWRQCAAHPGVLGAH